MSNLTDVILENPSDEHIKALLSNLAYENLSTGFNFSNLDNSFSIAEKNYLNENFEVLSVSDSNESGFQGCFLKNTKTNEIIFAIRGTETDKLEDVDDDLDIINSGMAYKQFIDAYNYYIKTVTATGDTGRLLTYANQQPAEGTAYIDTGDGHYIYFEDFTGTGNGYSNVSITGHSFGGHLAALLGVITGNETTIFNAPGYKDQPKLDFSYTSEDGTTENMISMVSGIISKLFNKDITSQDNIKHIYNDNSQEWIANYGTKWKNNTPIYCLQKGSSVHAIDEICTSYYAYETIKDIANGAESFHNDSTVTSFNETFENVYKAYCLNKGENYYNLDYSDYIKINEVISKINEWSEIQKVNGGAIKVDSYNHTTSLPITGTDGADIFYTGGGNDTINAGAGNDTVYGIDLNGDTTATTTSSKTINLGSGNDTYYGSNAKDTVSTTGTNTENDTNHIYLGGGNDNFIGGDGIDIVDGGSGATGWLSAISSESMTDSEETTNEIHLGGGNDEYRGGIGKDIVHGGDGDDDINAGDGENELYGDEGNDYINGGKDKDIIHGGTENDKIYGRDGENEIFGDAGDDRIYGGKDKDIIRGGTENDNIYGKDGENELYGDEGNDYIRGGKDKDIIYGGIGNDDIYGEDGENELYGEEGNDDIYGGKDNDIIYGGIGNDNIHAYEGNNIIDLGVDDDYDSVSIHNTSSGVDTIYNATSKDRISNYEGYNLNTLQQIGNDVIVYGNNGNKIVFKNVQLTNYAKYADLVRDGYINSLSDIRVSEQTTSGNADQLIQAMNSFSVSNSASTDTLSNLTEDVSDMYSLAASQDLTRKAI